MKIQFLDKTSMQFQKQTLTEDSVIHRDDDSFWTAPRLHSYSKVTSTSHYSTKNTFHP